MDTTTTPLPEMIRTHFVSVEEELERITVSDTIPSGRFLLVLCIVSIFINMYISWLVFKNWTTIRQSGFFNTNLLCLLLTLADLVFALFVGFPGGLHLSWINYFKRQPYMLFYSRKLGHILFEFIFLLRVLIIAVLSADRCIHIYKPVQYSRLVTLPRITGICVTTIIAPIMVRVIPTIIVLFLNKAEIYCVHFYDGASTAFERVQFYRNFSVPLTCSLDMRHRKGSAFPVVELLVLAIVTVAAWLTIIVSNSAILLVILKRLRSPVNKSSERKKKTTEDLIKGCLLVATIAVTFSLTSFPYVCNWIGDTLYRYQMIPYEMSDRVRFYLSILTFLSLIFHPWLYLLRLKSIRDLMPSFKASVAKVTKYKALGFKSPKLKSTNFPINDRGHKM